MNLTDEQKKKVSEWIEEGLKLSEVQTKVQKEFGITITYMEARFLMTDLKLQPKDKPEPAPPTPLPASKVAPAAAAANPMSPLSPEEGEELPPASNVKVNVDTVTRPGALVSGKVNWSDGKTSEWYLDQMGRLGLASPEPGYKPSQEDIYSFQEALQTQLAKLGL